MHSLTHRLKLTAATALLLGVIPTVSILLNRAEGSSRVQQPLTVKEVTELRGYLGERWQSNRVGSLHRFDIENYVRMVEARTNRAWWWIGEQDGKWLESAILSSARSDSELRAKASLMLDRVIASQEPDGYVGITAKAVRTPQQPLRGMDPYELYFTLHAFVTAYEQWGDNNALNAARKLADYFVANIGPGKAEFWPGELRPPENRGKQLTGQSKIAGHSVHYGWEGTLLIDPMLRLSLATGDRRYAEWSQWVVQNIDRWSGWDSFSKLDLVADGKMGIHEVQPYVHAHTFHMNFLGFLRLYELTGDSSYLRKVAGVWRDIAERQMYITGGVSVGEHYETGHIKPVSGNVVETCATTSWLQLTEYLLELTGEVKYADAMENLLWNHVFASQAIDGDCYRYHTAPNDVKPQGYFHGPDCCTSSGHRLVSLLPTFLYGKDERGLFVNQYSDSTVEIKTAERQVLRVRQSTSYPEEETVRLTIESAPSSPLAIRLRLPAWCLAPQLTLNGKSQTGLASGSYFCIERRWQTGDELMLVLPMKTKWVQSDSPWKTTTSHLPSGEIMHQAAKDSSRPWALTRGPLVYAVDTLWWNDTTMKAPAQVGENLAIVPAEEEIHSEPKPPGILGPAYTAVAHTTSGRKIRVLLVPFTNIGRWYRDGLPRPGRNDSAFSYAVWLLNTNAPEFQQRVELVARQQAQMLDSIDSVTVGDRTSENAHMVQGGTTGEFMNRTYRHGQDFSYRVKVKSNAATKLVVTYWGGDVNREFDVLADDRVVGTQKLQNNKPGAFYEETYDIPPDLVQGRTDDFGQPVDHVTLRFRTRTHEVAGGVYGFFLK